MQEVPLAVHLTPDELSDALGLSRKEVVKLCVQEAVPIYQGRIDKTLFMSSMVAAGRRLPEGALDDTVAPHPAA
jgi:hypothetical protein